MSCLSSLLISNVNVDDSRTLSIVYFGPIIIENQNRRACGIDIFAAQHRRFEGIIRQLSMIWEIALGRRDSAGMCWANLAEVVIRVAGFYISGSSPGRPGSGRGGTKILRMKKKINYCTYCFHH